MKDKIHVSTNFVGQKSEEEYNETSLLQPTEQDYNETTLLEEYEEEYNETTLLSDDDNGYMETTLLSEDNYYETTLLDETENETTLLSENTIIPKSAPRANLSNIISQEAVFIEKTPFVIGSSITEVDFYCNNPAVSRKHSKIIFMNHHYYLIDNHSTNKTVLDGTIIEPDKAIELYNGALIEMADELFQFHIENN